MGKNPIAFAVPFFFLFIFIELAYARWTNRRVYRLNDAFADLGCGITQQVIGVFLIGSFLALHVWIYEHLRLLDLPTNAWTWVFAIVAVDFCFYWWHRASHRVRVLWMAHIVHHQSEDMNLAVALRQAPLTNFTILPFYLPLTLLGVPTLVLFVAASLNTIYQFWIHSELIPKLGPIEWVLNTPSHHRAHHGINPRYIDKNYAGILIIWDRLFGTFEEESEAVVYGTVEPFGSFDPIWAQIQPVVALARAAASAPRMLDRFRIWFMPPEWSPEGVPGHAAAPVTPETRPKFDKPTTPRVRAYVVVQLALAVIGTFLLLLFHDELSLRASALGAGAILLTLLASAALIERRRWALPLEGSRLAVAGLAVLALVHVL